eukprot:GHVS01106646.1.p1 GENE.GHVS01106646.1~~GHVS01106646.1.p1  ORF type:complete len:130 (+),score=53.71 GHVS01106646.1:124-513(+)
MWCSSLWFVLLLSPLSLLLLLSPLSIMFVSGWEQPSFSPPPPPGWTVQQKAKKKFLVERSERAELLLGGGGDRVPKEQERGVEVFYDVDRELYLWLSPSASRERESVDMMEVAKVHGRRRLGGRREGGK